MLNAFIKFFLENKMVTFLLLILVLSWGIIVSPFKWDLGFLPYDPVPVDAIPDLGENQQIVFTEWMGKSPRDIEDQITYPLTTAMLGLPGVESIRSTSMFGLSSVYIIFDDDVEYYWSRSRVLEKLNSLPRGLLPTGVQPKLGPDATALGQIFWYTLEGRDENGKPAGGWDLHELRSIQDFYVRYALAGAEGVAEVATVGGHIKEYQVDLDPHAMKAYQISMMEVMEALQKSNQDVGANTIEINQVEYYIRGIGYVEKLEDIEEVVVRATDNTPLRLKDIARVQLGPADRSMLGILDKSGAEAVGGVVVARYGDNPLQVIENVKQKIAEISTGLPQKKLNDGRISKITVVPFYDRSNLIYETLGTLNEAVVLQILITIVVIIVMVYNLRASLLIAALLPLAVLMCFIFMKQFGIDANIVALSGIAIAIGTMVDLGIILNENILKHIEESRNEKPLVKVIYEASAEVSSAIVTAVATTVVSFIPVFTLEAAEGKLFGPLAYTKTFALIASLIFVLVFMPAFAHVVMGWKSRGMLKRYGNYLLLLVGIFSVFLLPWAGIVLFLLGLNNLLTQNISRYSTLHRPVLIGVTAGAVAWLLTEQWLPLGVAVSTFTNFFFISILLALVLGIFVGFLLFYRHILEWCLHHKRLFMVVPISIIGFGMVIWLGFSNLFGWLAIGFDVIGVNIRQSEIYSKLAHTFPGMGREFMPSLNEGSFLLMPTSMPHSGVEVNQRVLQQLDMLVTAIPEVESVVGKAGRAETALDPAPMSMFEIMINYLPEYKADARGHKIRYAVDKDDNFLEDSLGNLIPDPRGKYYRQWRDEIQSPDDIWMEISSVANIAGVTSAPKLQPIETRMVMLQTGMRAPMGIKVYGPDLEAIEEFSLQLERHLKQVPSVNPEAVFADRSLGKPYIEVELDRKAMSRYGLNIADVQEYIEVGMGGMAVTTTVEGRERYSIRLRYARDFREDAQSMDRILVMTNSGAQVPLTEMAQVVYRPGPMMIRGEDSFLVGYVLLDKRPEFAEGNVVEDAQAYLQDKINSGELQVPPGVSFKFSGSYENQLRAEKRLAMIIPLCLFVIFLILYFQFRRVSTPVFIFSAIAMAFSGGFIMLWLYGQPWFMDFSIFGTNVRELFQMKSFNMSVAVWVGFIALFGIATDDGVVMATYLKQNFEVQKPTSQKMIREKVVQAGLRRIRPCIMTSATTLLALLPVLSSSGRGSDIMIPMAIPSFGGMTVALISLFVVPVLYCWWEERKLKVKSHEDVTLDTIDNSL